MDVKDLQSEATLGERNDGSKYASSGVTLPYSRNKSYQDVNSVSLGKVDAPTARPCAVIGPDRVLPPPVSSDTIKKSAFEAWCADNVYRHPPEYPHKMTNYNTPIRNISPRQTFQENMQRIMVPTYNSLKGNEEYNSSIDKNVSMTKNIKPNIPIETKYCEVPYSGNAIIHEQKSVRNTELSASNVNPVLTRSAPQGWPAHLRQSRPYGAPELYQYPDYTNCAGPRPVPMSRPHRTAHEDLSHGYADPYCHDVRFKPYTTVKDRYPQARYEFISNYPNPFHPPSAYPPHKYDMQKPIPQPYAYQQVPLKYLDNRIPDPVIDGYQRSTQQSSYNLPFHNQMIHPAYGPIVGNCIQNKFPCPPEGSVKSLASNKQPYEANKMYAEYENARSKAFSVSENYYFNEMQRPPPHIKNQVMPNYAINMHRFPPHPYYTKDSASLKNYEYMSHFRNIDPSMLSQSRIPSQFSPNGITITPSDPNITLDHPQIQGSSPEDYGYVSQSPTGNLRNTDFAVNRVTNEFYKRYDSRYGHTIRPPPMMSKHEPNPTENSKDKKNIDVRQFLQMWNEVDDENAENATKEPVTQYSNDVNKITNQYETVKNQDQLYVLGLVNVPSEELGKYDHIQKVSKLPENIKGYNSIELLNQFEEVIESSNVNNFKSKSSTPNDITYQMTMKKSSSRLSLLPRPVSPLDVEAKISQSVIHKEVGCNFEIKPCSPKMLNVEAATPIHNLLGERVIEKVSNPLIISSPLMHSEDKLNCNALTHQEQRKSPNENLKNTSCKMSNTQFNRNDTVRSNYSLQDLESNSGICLASLPRLDNDIELNFPEVNQQFINANKGESVITATKDLPSLSLEHIDNENSTEHNICEKLTELPSVSDSEREFSKLSKYRKIKKYGPEPVEKEISFSSTQNMRTDSVIIKNPDNHKIFDQNKETLSAESSLIRIRDLSNDENYVDNVDTDKEFSNKLNNAKIYDHTDIAIDFSLNKSDNNNTTSADNTNTATSTIEHYVENGPNLDSSIINNFIKHSKISQNSELLNDEKIENEIKIKTLFSEADTVLRDKHDFETNMKDENSGADKKENSQTIIEPQLKEFNKFVKTDDIRSLKKSPCKIRKNDEDIICEIKSKEGITIAKAKHEENKNETESHNLTSVALSADDFLNNKHSKERNIDTIPEIIESNSDIQFDESTRLDLPDLSVENVIPSYSHSIQNAPESKKENEAEMSSQESDRANIEATFTEQTDLCELNGGNEILPMQKDCVSINAIQPYSQKAQEGKQNETDSRDELFPEDNNEYNTNSLKNETDLVQKALDLDICCKDKKLSESTENSCLKQDAQKGQNNIKDVLLLEGQDGDNSHVSFGNKTNEQYAQIGQKNIKDVLLLEGQDGDNSDVGFGNKTNEQYAQIGRKNIEDVLLLEGQDGDDSDVVFGNKTDEQDMQIGQKNIKDALLLEGQDGDNSDVGFGNKTNEQYAQIGQKNIKDVLLLEGQDGDNSDVGFGNKTNEQYAQIGRKNIEDVLLLEGQDGDDSDVSFGNKTDEQDAQIGQKNIKDVLLLEGQDGDNSDVGFGNKTNVTQDKFDSNLNCCEEKIYRSSENKDIVTLQSNIKLQQENENYRSMFNKSVESETDKLQEVLDANARQQVLNESNEHNNNVLSNTNIALKDRTKNSNELVIEKVKESGTLCRDNTLSEPQTALMLEHSQIKDNNLNSNEKSNPLETSMENSRKNIIPLLNTDEDSNQLPSSFETSNPYLNVSNDKANNLDKNRQNKYSDTNNLPNGLFAENVIAETSIATMENVVKQTKIDEKCNERSHSNITSNEMEFENNACHIRSFRSCQLKKELFSPFIQKLMALDEGPMKPQSLENNINVEANTANLYFGPDSEDNLEIEQIRVIDHTFDFINTVSCNDKTCEIDSFKNVEITSCNLICENIDTMNESIKGNDVVLEYGAQNMTSSGSSPNNNIKERISASGSGTDLCTEISSKECFNINSTDKPFTECVHVEDTLTNSFITAECPENIEISFTSSLLPSPENTDTDNITTVSENDNLNKDDLRDPEDNNEATEQILTSMNKKVITNSDINNECPLNIVTLQDSSDKYMMQNKHNQDSCRPCLKRSLSDSALDSFNDSSDAFYSGWRSKRPKTKICNVLEPDIIFDSNSQNIRRKSISSIYNEQNVSFCILIDNNCIITEEENEGQDEICFTEVSEACLTDLQESVNGYDNILTPIPDTPEPSEECSHDYSETQEVEESWVDDVGCMETVVSDDVAEDITISASSSPERMNSLENDESGIFLNSEHTDKVKHIYGAKMCNDDIMFLETLYRTPQMNVNKIINRESQVSEEYVQYYNKDSLEKVLSEPNCHEDLCSDLEMLESSDANNRNPLDDVPVKNIQQDENSNNDILHIAKSAPMCNTYNIIESNDLQNNESLYTNVETQDETIHSCESSIDNVFSYSHKDEYRSYTSSTSPEVSSTTSEERNSSILLKITNFKGSRVSQINDIEQETKSISCKFTELNDYSSSQNFKTNRPLITKAAQKYIPPLEETLGDLKIRLPLPQHSLHRLKQLKLLKTEPKSNKCNTKSKPDIPKKPKPKFEDVLKSIDEIQFKMHMEKSKKSKKTIPKVVIKKNENGSHYASTTNIKPFNPDLTGRKWQPWVFLEKNHFIDKMALKNKRKAIFNHRKNTYVLADKFRKYKSIGNAKFVISQQNLHNSSIGHLKCTIRLKHTY